MRWRRKGREDKEFMICRQMNVSFVLGTRLQYAFIVAKKENGRCITGVEGAHIPGHTGFLAEPKYKGTIMKHKHL